jgi:hypothetical protein
VGRFRADAQRLIFRAKCGVRRAASIDPADVFAIAGFGGIAAGTWLLNHAWSLIICGTLLLAAASIGAWRGGKPKDGFNG